MKINKILGVCALVVALAVSANAAQVKWGVSGGALGNGNTLTLFTGGSTAGVVTAILDGTFSTAGSVATGTKAPPMPFYSQIVTVPGVGGDNYTGYTVMFQSGAYDGTVGATGNYMILDPVSVTLPDTGAPALSFVTGSWTEYTVVPEPTSMALIALGIVALGLRRKRA